MVALTVVLASVVFYLAISLNAPQNLTRTSMKILAFNSSTLGITSMVGDSIPIDNVNIIVGPESYNASGIKDSNANGMWDPGETIFLYGLDLAKQTSVIVTAGTTVLLPGTVQWGYNPTPSSGNGSTGGATTSYQPGIRMTTFSGPSFASPVNARTAASINFASPDAVSMGYPTCDTAWPQSEAGVAHNFSVKFEGFLYVDQNNTYEFRIVASDGIYMDIDDVEVIGVTGDHVPSTRMANHYLSAGYHKLEIGYQNHNEVAVVGEYYIKKQTDGTYVPPSLFYLESTNA